MKPISNGLETYLDDVRRHDSSKLVNNKSNLSGLIIIFYWTKLNIT